ncbi:MarR family winged helix-turn-helix transcriptional regulator [Geothermobacter hydrogeniphilus]|uniref:MarR family transcriptional regulator n=1 Tax=Geothermobacter hydrogeniphilus TaxID=1969733 RepID=A0A1X0Y3N6_9BACT|nr:MarR family transcriptional regulator [Geothermobacter hydrogeniphilus]ORJ59821.1 MarR family transcriptional regulator [Geothermobacter hydrogeniphilus]
MATKYPGTTSERRALSTYINLLRCSEVVTADTTRHLAAEKLTVGQFGTLEALYHLGPLCQRDIGRKLLRSGGNVTTVVDNLEKRGLVKRRRQAEDRRYYSVALTDSGRELIARIMPRQVAGIKQRLDVLSAEEQETLRRLCRKLGVGD